MNLLGLSLYFAAIILDIACCGLRVNQNDQFQIPVVAVQNCRNSSDCGIFAMAAALRSMGKNIDVGAFLCKDYLGSFGGSSPKELVKLAEKNGKKSYFVENLSVDLLRQTNTPVLLLLRDRAAPKNTGHWVTFLGCYQDEALVFDSLNSTGGQQLVPLPELLVNWQGEGIVFSEHSKFITTTILVLRSLNCMVPLFLFVLGVFVFDRTIVPNRIVPVIRFFYLGLITSLAIYVLSNITDILGSSKTRIAPFLAAKYSAVPIPEYLMLERDLKSGSERLQFVDARLPTDVDAFPILDAINLHPELSMVDLEVLASQMNRNEKVVIFCKGGGCSYSTVVGRRLRELGFEHIFISRKDILEIATMLNEQ